jgi:hypothetical protein
MTSLLSIAIKVQMIHYCNVTNWASFALDIWEVDYLIKDVLFSSPSLFPNSTSSI